MTAAEQFEPAAEAIHICPTGDDLRHVMTAQCPCHPVAEHGPTDLDGAAETTTWRHQFFTQPAVPTPIRWEPDLQMVVAVLSTPKHSRKMTELDDGDRSWLVAGLSDAGITAKDIADRTGCSLRLIRAIRAEPMTQMAELWLQATRDQDRDLRAEQCQHQLTRDLLAHAQRRESRLRKQLDQILDAHMAGTLKLFHCGHPRLEWNIYKCRVNDRGHERDRDFCRTCGNRRSAGYQTRAKRAKLLLNNRITLSE